MTNNSNKSVSILIKFSQIKDAADSARNNDTDGLKKDVPLFLNDDGLSVIKSIKPASSSKSDRGFHHDIMGRFLCPVTLDWDDLEYVLVLYSS